MSLDLMTRRRFLSIAAASLATRADAAPLRWHGRALGADVALTLYGPRDQAGSALRDIRLLLARVETLFSLYNPNSALSRLNRAGSLARPDPALHQLMQLAGQVCTATGGVFDPSVQPLWQALAQGGDADAARALVGWNRVRVTPQRITLGPGQALTLNGIAQGFATDMARQMLQQAGLTRILVNIGEFGAVGGPFRLGISDPEFGLVSEVQITNRAIATSSPGAMRLRGAQSHILHPRRNSPPVWSTVSVQADSAAIADAASTAFCLMGIPEINLALQGLEGCPQAILVARSGVVTTLGQRSSGGEKLSP